MLKNKSEWVTGAEWFVAGLITLATICLHLIRVRNAGPLWRDEIAAVNLARMPSWSEILRYFPHEAFPLLFPAILRTYTAIAGTTTLAFRIFGLLVGTIGLGIIWLNTRLIRRGLPLIALALFGLNYLFFVWGDSVRGYGLGFALMLLTFGLFGRTIIKPSTVVFGVGLCSAVLSVHCLLANAVLLFAIGISAALAHLYRKQMREALIILGIGCIAALSIIPYVASYQKAREWDVVLRTWLGLKWLWIRFFTALGNPIPAAMWVWIILLGGSLLAADWVLRQTSSAARDDKALAIFGLTSCILAPTCYCIFLKILGYPTQDWYYLGLVGILLAAIDLIVGLVALKVLWIRIARLSLVVVMLVALLHPALIFARMRMTSADVAAEKLKRDAEPDDLILVLPWYFGISFAAYYGSNTPWQTLPPMSDLRMHRYDLAKEQMVASDPLGPSFQKAANTLKAGHRVWIVSTVKFSPNGRPPQYVAPAPWDPVGWNENSYREAWMTQTEYFVHTRGARYKIENLTLGLTNPYEDVTLTLVEGFREPTQTISPNNH